MSDTAFVAAIRPHARASSTIGVKKSVVSTSPVSPKRHTAASSPVSGPTSRSGCTGAKPASASVRIVGASLQPQPAPWLYSVSLVIGARSLSPARRSSGGRRRWTGIEPAREVDPLSPALKAGAATRSADTSVADGSARRGDVPSTYSRSVIIESPTLSPTELHEVTGWELKPEGACKDDRCVPMTDLGTVEGRVDVMDFAQRLGMPVARDESHGLWALGPESGGRVLASADFPPMVLSDFGGGTFDLATLRGRKVLLVAWASY